MNKCLYVCISVQRVLHVCNWKMCVCFKKVSSFHSLTDCHQLSVDVVEVVPEKGVIGKQFRKEGKAIMETLSSFSSPQADTVERESAEKG